LEAADPEWKSLTLFGLYTGQRLADLAVLTWDNVDLLKNKIRLRTRKNWQTAYPVDCSCVAIDFLPTSESLARTSFDMATRQGRSGNLSNQFGQPLAEAGFREKKTHEGTGQERDGRRASNVFESSSSSPPCGFTSKDAGIPEAVVMELIGYDSKEM